MSDEEVIEAARQANIHDFVKSLPMVSLKFNIKETLLYFKIEL